MSDIRLNKYLSQQGICSRRKADYFIEKGWVLVNGQPVKDLGVKIVPDRDHIVLHSLAQQELQSFLYLKFYKPRGVVTHSPRSDEQEIKQLLPRQYQVCAPVGRLDKDSEGLILLTNDGLFTRKMLDDSRPHRREYLVKVNKPLTPDMIDKLEKGVVLFDTQLKPCQIDTITSYLYKITLYEGKNRQIRRMIQKVGSYVVMLKRVSFGPYRLDSLKPSEWLLIEG